MKGLRLASAQPAPIQWQLPDSISFRRTTGAPRLDQHLYFEAPDTFRADLGNWEHGVLAEELSDPCCRWLAEKRRPSIVVTRNTI